MEGPEFFASEKWGGVRMGYVYTTGARGLGYYRDAAKDRTAPIKNPLLQRAAPRKRDGASRKEIWEKARTDTSAESKSGGREGRSIEDRLKNAGLLNEVMAVKEKEAEEKEKAAKQAALFQAAAENPGAVPYIPAGEFKGPKVGYVFKLGDDGVGYYLDDKAKAEEAHSQALMVIPQEEKKVNNLLYQLALRGGATQNDDGEIVYPYDALAAVQAIERLTRPGHKFMNLNPFHVLELPQEHDVAQLKEAFGKLNALLDPEKNTDARCLPLQEVVLKAFRTLANPDKRDRAMETYVQARDKVEYSWKKRNKAAKKDGQAETPFILNEAEVQEGDGKVKPRYSPVFEAEVEKMVFKMMAELDERFKRSEATFERNAEESRLRAEASKEKKRKHDEWEDEREERVGGWRMFSKKKKKRLGNGSRLWSKAEERASHQEIKDAKQRLESEKGSGGANNIYKQSWR